MPPQFPAACRARYRPQRPLASGGFGTVWLAEQTELGRSVAIKVLDSAKGETDALDRFRNEARIAATLSHPAIVKVLDHGTDEDAPWIAFEHVDGPSLDDVLQRGPLPLADAVEAAHQLAGALAEAHAHGILHRDVKPANVMRAGPRTYKLTDFGIAKWRDRSAVVTAPDMILGSPAYVAPERIRGEPATASSDLYALGVTLYELACGHPPFQAPTASQLLSMQLSEVAPRLSSLCPGVPPALDQLVASLLAKSPLGRPPTAAAVQAALEGLAPLPARGAAAPRPGVASVRAPGWRTAALRRVASPAGLAVVLLAAVLALIGVPRAQQPPAPPPSPSPSTLPAQRAPVGAEKTEMDAVIALFYEAANRLAILEPHSALGEPADPAERRRWADAAVTCRLICDRSVAWAEHHLALGDAHNTARALRCRARGWAVLSHVVWRRLQARPGPDAPLDADGAARYEAWLREVGIDLPDLVRLWPHGHVDIGRLCSDVIGIARLCRLDPSGSNDPLEGGRRLRGALDAAPAPLGPALAASLDDLWRWSLERDLENPPFDEMWERLDRVRALTPDAPPQALVSELLVQVDLANGRELQLEQRLDGMRRNIMVSAGNVGTVSAQVDAELRRVLRLQRCSARPAAADESTANLVAALHVRAIALELWLRADLERVHAYAPIGRGFDGEAGEVALSAARYAENQRPMGPGLADVIGRWERALLPLVRTACAGARFPQLAAVCENFSTLGRRVRQAGDALAPAVDAALKGLHRDLESLPGPAGAALRELLEGHYAVGLAMHAERLHEALASGLPALARLPDMSFELDVLWWEARRPLADGRPPLRLPPWPAGMPWPAPSSERPPPPVVR